MNVFGSYELIQTTDTANSGVKPSIFANEGTAHRWNLAPNFRLNRVISIVATYQGRDETTFAGTRVRENELRLETRAFF